MATRTIAKPSLTLKHRYNAPPAQVFSAWTDAKKIARWMGPEGVEALSMESDARTGGRYRFVMRSPDGETHDVSGVFREVVADRKLVFTWAWKSTPERESLVTVTIEPDGDGSMLTLHHEQFFDETARDHHQHGWIGSLKKLDRLLAEAR